jgi:head-tail adaptor
MNPVRIGAHRSRITLANPNAETLDSFGNPSEPFTPFGTFWCLVEALRGNELVAAKQVKAQATVSIQMRWQGSSIVITPVTRGTITNASGGVRTFGFFETVNIEERNRLYKIMAYEIQQGVTGV